MKSNRKEYDAVFLTNVPAFYKVNLFNEISKHKEILVIFVSNESKIRNENFYSFDFKFDHSFLNEGNFEDRSKTLTLFNLLKKLRTISYKKIVFSGWEVKEVTLASLFNKRKKNAIVIESSIIETKKSGLTWFLKKLAIGRMSLAYPSGQLQKAILETLSFKGQTVITHGVGLSNFNETELLSKKKYRRNQPLRFIYVGRISPEKNIEFIVNVFKSLPYELILIGEGSLKKQLEDERYNNIKFLGYIENKKLSHELLMSDCFILPSLSEPWGLVVEEALTLGLPVIVSNHVGCHSDLVNDKNGIVFDVNNEKSFIDALNIMDENYEHYACGASLYNAKEIAQAQVAAYVDSI
ncbi:glycosyltransferase [Cronobacter turicensis]|uniref:glycosyltransferase n=1 Tax=Cronobacter turicensis TaxID=413502 RepID=UPI0024C27154|nr:glycosyltransferase [Cronobacter turicensis]MDK1226868.1 glycosyltransferase [Cronobacter turicensis]